MIKIPKKIKTLLIKHFSCLTPNDLERLYRLGYSHGRKDASKTAVKIFQKELKKERR